MITICVCITVLAVAAICAWLVHELVKDASCSRIVLAEKERAAASATGELADAVRALQLVADRLAPAPVRVGKPTTIHTIDDHAITGVLLAEHNDRTRLADAHIVTSAGKQPIPGGHASILKTNESWRQEHDG